MKPQAALVGPYCAVKLDAIAAVYAGFALIVNPRDAENDHALRLYNPLQNGVLLQVGAALHNGLQAGKHFLDSLEKLALVGATRLHLGKNF